MAIENISGRMRVPIAAGTGQKAEVEHSGKSAAKPAEQVDSIAITPAAQNLKKALESSSSASVVDAKRVAEVKKALEEGSYQVNAEKIAEKMIQHEKLMAQLDNAGK